MAETGELQRQAGDGMLNPEIRYTFEEALALTENRRREPSGIRPLRHLKQLPMYHHSPSPEQVSQTDSRSGPNT